MTNIMDELARMERLLEGSTIGAVVRQLEADAARLNAVLGATRMDELVKAASHQEAALKSVMGQVTGIDLHRLEAMRREIDQLTNVRATQQAFDHWQLELQRVEEATRFARGLACSPSPSAFVPERAITPVGPIEADSQGGEEPAGERRRRRRKTFRRDIKRLTAETKALNMALGELRQGPQQDSHAAPPDERPWPGQYL
jgi:hypothetical protein